MTGLSADQRSREEIEFLINHIFLPPQLPHQDDSYPNHESTLVNATIGALEKFKHVWDGPPTAINAVRDMVTTLKATGDAFAGIETVHEDRLYAALQDLPVEGGTLLLHIQAQNAGVMISKVESSIHVEAFELSPLNEAVLITEGRLRRCFPGCAMALNIKAFQEPGLQATMAHALAKMSHQPAVDTKPKVTKAGAKHDENRDTTHPKIVTELFMNFLRPIGHVVDVLPLWKNTREEVLWHDALLPWRRSPLWMLLRVAMQLKFARLQGPNTLPADSYKRFMVFLMGDVLQLSLRHELPCELLSAMNAKLARRIFKLEPAVLQAGLTVAEAIMSQTTDQIRARWKRVMKRNSPRLDLSNLRSLNFNHDAVASLSGLGDFLHSLSTRADLVAAPPFRPTSVLVQYQSHELPSALASSEDYVVYNLQAFEAWVASHLKQWLERHMDDPNTCGRLGVLIRDYYRTAWPTYAGNPESLSVLLLTILEIWIACDRAASHQCDLLQHYDPGIPLEVLHSLILPSKSQMQRALCAEDYFAHRRRVANHAAPAIFRDYGGPSCFAVKYYDRSSVHQELLRRIEKQATQDKQAKVNELFQKKARYNDLMQRYEESSCDYYDVVTEYDLPERRHCRDCVKCGYKSRARAIDIDVHEWPLPGSPCQAKCTVFELQVPSFFGQWRDTALFMLLNVLRMEPRQDHVPRAAHPLKDDRGLMSFTSAEPGQRLVLLSEAKPHTVTHRRNKPISSTTQDDVCLASGLRYQYFDDDRGYFVGEFHYEDTIPRLLAYQLPARSSFLQQFLFRPVSAPDGPSPNTVIASQYNCPTHMSLDEYKALCTIPLGHEIQWQNILLQLSAPSVDFKKVETSLVVRQAIHQAGPRRDESVLRASHDVVADPSFASVLLKSLEEGLQRVKENWESSQAISTFIAVAVRLLSLTADENIQTRCRAYLRETRAITLGWIDQLKRRAYGATDHSHRAELLSQAVEVALICADSMNVDEQHLCGVLADPDDASVFIQCCIAIEEGASAIAGASDLVVPILHQRWKSLCYRTYPVLARKVLEGQSGWLDDAIQRTWSAYKPGDGWRALPAEFEFWLFTPLTSPCGDKSMLVHYNLLTGELLVDGLPLTRPPLAYRQHPTYRMLFGRSEVEVMPSTAPGMQFSGKRDHAGYTVHLGGIQPDCLAHARKDLLVRAEKDGRTYDLIPSRVLHGKFPLHFTEDYIHWYDVKDDCVEFRPRKRPWTTSPNHWRLMRDEGCHRWRLVTEGRTLISVESLTAHEISRLLSPLEDHLRIHTVFDEASSALEIELPRLSLGFLLDANTPSLQSKQHRGFSVDSDQSLDTLVGLESKLMLRDGAGGRRMVLLPEGRESFHQDGDHVRVTIDHDSVVKVHTYVVDYQLCRLVDNGSSRSKLWLGYMHALTSFCLCDPLIQRTGTEQALIILKSAAVRSFDRLTPDNIDILDRLAQLTPGRRFYPANERVMQTVTWKSELGFLAQHGEFYWQVKVIFDQAEKGRIFYPEAHLTLPLLDYVEPVLGKRDRIRSSTFRISDFGAEGHTVMRDATYSARDRAQSSPQGFRAFAMASLVLEENEILHYPVSKSFSAQLWHFLEEHPPSLGPENSIPASKLKYDADLLQAWPDVVSRYWCCLHRTFSRTNPRFDKFRLMIWLSTIAFAKHSAKDGAIDIIQAMGSLFTLSKMARLTPPAISSFRLSEGATFRKEELRPALQSAFLPFAQCPESQLACRPNESQFALKFRRKDEFQSARDGILNDLLGGLQTQWPCQAPVLPHVPRSHIYVDIGKAMKIAKPKFRAWHDNLCLEQYLHQLGKILRDTTVTPLSMPWSPVVETPIPTNPRTRSYVSTDDIFAHPPPSVACENLLSLTTASDTNPRLASLLDNLDIFASSQSEKNYVKDLRASLLSFQSWDRQNQLSPDSGSIKSGLQKYRDDCQIHVEKVYHIILSAVTDGDGATGSISSDGTFRHEQLAKKIEHCPRLCPQYFLQQLSRHRWGKLQAAWRSCIVQYALALAKLQRAERLVSLSDSRTDLVKELRNPGHTNWDPLEQPESLLLEVESGFLIRGVQEDIARQMRDATQNVMMQLNMGEGKSSVIVPVVAAALADLSRLVRVIVAKPQSKQMSQMLVSKLGGLLDRRIYYMPFSRSLRLGSDTARMIDDLCRECMNNGGILLVHPEHILSFKLMGLECLISGKDKIGRALLQTQKFFDTFSQDIVDESDENFSVKFELIYTMGMQQPIELSPRRWVCIQQVLGLVKDFAPAVAQGDPMSVDVGEGPLGAFPPIRILNPDGQRRLVTLIAERVCEDGLHEFPVARQPRTTREAVLRYVAEPNISPDDISLVESEEAGGFWTAATSQTLLLLRGLLAGGVLSFVLSQKRWRVQYGLDSARLPRTQLAVPYRAKDSPTPRSEFSHPDVVILLTCLSHYYGGLDDDDLFCAFAHLLSSDGADVEYQAWVKDAPRLPVGFQQLSSINLKDRIQCTEQVFPPLRFAKNTVDYFLTHIVFPRQMRQFPHKLSASGWDIGEVKALPTTGFSGTNDSRLTLPLSVAHLDLPEQSHTNALVLEVLLRPENSVKLIPTRRGPGGSTAEILLDLVMAMDPPAQVILDVGAQVLELNNQDLAREWLKRLGPNGQAQAVVFFNEDDELSVLDRTGRTEPLQISPFANQLDVCLVFLDEAHTRGTDLRLPEYYKAAVTLGPKVTKDRLIQACMRMRKLGHGQSVVFCVPAEIQVQILAQRPSTDQGDLEVADVLCWAIAETWLDLRRSMPLWAMQGRRFERQRGLWAEAHGGEGPHMSRTQAERFLEDESQSLDERYRPRRASDTPGSTQTGESKSLQRIAQRCLEFASLEPHTATLLEEQERELSPEMVQEREVQRAAPAEPAEHQLHPDVTSFVDTGVIPRSSKAFTPAFETLRRTSAASHLDVAQFPVHVLVTADFARTVESSRETDVLDTYQRPVQWILTSYGNANDKRVKDLVIISPYEAQMLQRRIRQSERVALHLYAPRPNLGIPRLDRLNLFTVSGRPAKSLDLPRRLANDFNLFAGQLYLSSFTEYTEVCTALGLSWQTAEEGSIIAADGFIISAGDGRTTTAPTFTTSPVAFLRVLMMKIRKNCEEIDKTHIGAILGGRLLRPSDFEESEEQ